MKMEITVAEARELFNGLNEQPGNLFICLKMEVNWRNKPIGKVPMNLPTLRKWAGYNFTHNS